jgi:hypothetical protein
MDIYAPPQKFVQSEYEAVQTRYPDFDRDEVAAKLCKRWGRCDAVERSKHI